MRPTLRLLASGLLFLLASCSSTPIMTAPQAAASSVQAVPCPSLPPLHYKAPTNKVDADSFIAKTLADPKNSYDTPETVTEILKLNAAIASVCFTVTK